jgi:hypothetical protein
MAWTTPRTWVAGEVVTAALMNTHVRDNLKAIGDGWTSYTPTLGGWTLGNGTLTGSWRQAGKLTFYKIFYTVGSTDTLSGTLTFALPASAAGATGDPRGAAHILDTSASSRFNRFVCHSSATNVYVADASDARVTPTVPFTFATGDTVRIVGTYEAS